MTGSAPKAYVEETGLILGLRFSRCGCVSRTGSVPFNPRTVNTTNERTPQ